MKKFCLILIVISLMVGCSRNPKQPSQAPQETKAKRYVGHSPDQCAGIRFVCDPGEKYFADEKGCGCEKE